MFYVLYILYIWLICLLQPVITCISQCGLGTLCSAKFSRRIFHVFCRLAKNRKNYDPRVIMFVKPCAHDSENYFPETFMLSTKTLHCEILPLYSNLRATYAPPSALEHKVTVLVLLYMCVSASHLAQQAVMTPMSDRY